MASPRQIAANRLNAEKSTGPTSAAGKLRSRGNAVKHGLSGEGIVLPDEEAQAVAARMAEWRDVYKPATVEDDWFFEQVVVNSVRIDRCRALETQVRIYEARRAAISWDDDRRLAAEDIAASLAKHPSRVSRRLARTRQGCDWLQERWRALGAIFARDGEWTPPQRSLALDLLGTPPELRDAGPIADPPALVAREVARLERLEADSLAELDGYECAAAGLGLEFEQSVSLGRIRRYEASCMRRFQWARNRLLHSTRSAAASAPVTPTPVPSPPPPPPPPPPAEPPTVDVCAPEEERFRETLTRKAARAATFFGKVTDTDPFDPLPPSAPASVAFSVGQPRPPVGSPPVKRR